MFRGLWFVAALSLAATAVAPDALAATKPVPVKKKPQPPAKETRDLVMNEGTMQLGGAVTMNIASGGGASGVSGTIAPAVGYFVADRVELLGDVSLGFAQGYTSYGFGAGGRVFADLGNPWAYVGALFGYGGMSVKGAGTATTGTSTGAFELSPLLGVAVPLAKNLAADFGARFDISFAKGATMVNIPMGYTGVQAFFK